MTKNNYRFAHKASRVPLFELEVEPITTVGALKALAEKHLSNEDNLCPMQYFVEWYCEGKVGMTCIEERANGLMLSEAGLADESLLYLEGPLFTEDQADVGRAIAAVRAESKVANAELAAQHAAHVQVLMDDIRSLRAATEARLDSMALALHDVAREAAEQRTCFQEGTKAKFSEILSNQRLQAVASNDTALSQFTEIKGLSNEMVRMQQEHSDALNRIAARMSIQPNVCADSEADKLLLKHNKRPLKALYEALMDTANQGVELPMAIILDRRCGIERRAKEQDGLHFAFAWAPVVFDFNGATPLLLAIYEGRIDVAKALLAAGADPNAKDLRGHNSLMAAARNANLDAIESLISYGADINAVDNEGIAPIHYATVCGQASIIESLVRFGANLEAIDEYGRTPLHRAVDAGYGCTKVHGSAYVETITALVMLGANQAAVNREGQTPLHCAARAASYRFDLRNNGVDAIEAFRCNVAAFEATLSVVDKEGRTPLQAYHPSISFSKPEDKRKIFFLLTPNIVMDVD